MSLSGELENGIASYSNVRKGGIVAVYEWISYISVDDRPDPLPPFGLTPESNSGKCDRQEAIHNNPQTHPM